MCKVGDTELLIVPFDVWVDKWYDYIYTLDYLRDRYSLFRRKISVIWNQIHIDKCLVGLIKKLNKLGRYTRESCCGHGKKNGYIKFWDGLTLTIKQAEDLIKECEMANKNKKYLVDVSECGDKRWYKYPANIQQLAVLHCEHGPAVELGARARSWFLDGQQYTEEEWKAKLNTTACDGKVVEIDGKKYKLTAV